MPEYGSNWVRYKEFSSIGRLIRDLPDDWPEREALANELREAHDTMECEAFNAWVPAFRERVEDEKRKAEGGLIQ